MRCPVCKSVGLQSKEVESNLLSLSCPQCEGQWIKSFQYWKWLEKHGPNLPELPKDAAHSVEVSDTARAKLCPECGRLLIRHRVGRGLDFYLDRCGHCAGIWFDKNEWQALKDRNLHDDVHFIFSAAWQARERKHELQERHDQRMSRKLGETDMSEILRIKSWIDAHPQRDELYAILLHREIT